MPLIIQYLTNRGAGKSKNLSGTLSMALRPPRWMYGRKFLISFKIASRLSYVIGCSSADYIACAAPCKNKLRLREAHSTYR